MWPGMGIVGLGMILALVGLFGVICRALFMRSFCSPCSVRPDFVFWRSFARFRGPRWEDGARRVERDSDLPNRPITEGTDKVAAGRGDPFAERLWRAHIIRLLASAKNLTLRLPTTGHVEP